MVYISVFTCSNLFSKARGLSCAANTDTSHLLRMPDVCVGGKQTVYYGSPTLNVFKKHIFKWICSRTFSDLIIICLCLAKTSWLFKPLWPSWNLSLSKCLCCHRVSHLWKHSGR